MRLAITYKIKIAYELLSNPINHEKEAITQNTTHRYEKKDSKKTIDITNPGATAGTGYISV